MRRVIFYLFYDSHGIVDDYITHKLQALRPHAEHIFVVSNSALTPEGRDKLESVADTVWVRKNIGFDVWAYRDAMERFGADRLAEYDELILMNYTFFGPIHPFDETFARADTNRNIDFWGLTAHKRIDAKDPDADEPELELHIQSHWVAARRTLFTSIEWEQYWRDMPLISSYEDSIAYHEARFTKWFSDRGFRYDISFPPEDYPAANPIFDNALLMIENGCPILKRRIFFHDPAYLDQNAILGRRIMQAVGSAGYPEQLIWRNVIRSAEPRTLHTNMTLMSILSTEPSLYRPEPPPRICVLAHMYYDDMLDEMMSAILRIPVPFDLVVTTDSEAKRSNIVRNLHTYDLNKVDVRVVESNRGRSESAFLITCRDVLTSGAYDLVLKVHSKKSSHNGYNQATYFKEHTFDNVLASPGYVARVIGLFDKDPLLGMAFPPLVHIGYPTLGHSWFTNREPARELAEKVGIKTVFDHATPLAPNGGMFWARPEALAKLAQHPFEFADFAPGEEGYRDGELPHVLERLYGYAALDAGYTLRVVATPDWAEIDYTFLEYKLQRVSNILPAFTLEQLHYITRLQHAERELIELRAELAQRAEDELAAEAARRPRIARMLDRVRLPAVAQPAASTQRVGNE